MDDAAPENLRALDHAGRDRVRDNGPVLDAVVDLLTKQLGRDAAVAPRRKGRLVWAGS
jgi:hypothetical protein